MDIYLERFRKAKTSLEYLYLNRVNAALVPQDLVQCIEEAHLMFRNIVDERLVAADVFVECLNLWDYISEEMDEYQSRKDASDDFNPEEERWV